MINRRAATMCRVAILQATALMQNGKVNEKALVAEDASVIAEATLETLTSHMWERFPTIEVALFACRFLRDLVMAP